MIRTWFRRSPPAPAADPLADPGQWPLALRVDGHDDADDALGRAIHMRTAPAHTPAAPARQAVYLTAAGLRRPLVVLGADAPSTTAILLRLALRAMEETARTVVYVQGVTTAAPVRQVTALASLLGRRPVVWTPSGPVCANWVAASDTAMHRRLRELLRESPLMDDSGDTVDLILHTLLSLSLDPVRSVDDLVARCRTLYAYAAQMQSAAASTAAKVVSLTALTPPPPPVNGDAHEVAVWDALATRRRMLEWAVKTDLSLIADMRDLCAVRLSDLAAVVRHDGWSLDTTESAIIGLPDAATVEQRAQRRFVLDAILHDLLVRVDAERPITLILDGVAELWAQRLPHTHGGGDHASQTLLDRLVALPALAERGLQVMLSAPTSADLDPTLCDHLLAADPVALIHATRQPEPVLETLGGQTLRDRPTLQPGPRGPVVTAASPSAPTWTVPACRAQGLAADEAYLVTGQAAALIQLIPIAIPPPGVNRAGGHDPHTEGAHGVTS